MQTLSKIIYELTLDCYSFTKPKFKLMIMNLPRYGSFFKIKVANNFFFIKRYPTPAYLCSVSLFSAHHSPFLPYPSPFLTNKSNSILHLFLGHQAFSSLLLVSKQWMYNIVNTYFFIVRSSSCTLLDLVFR